MPVDPMNAPRVQRKIPTFKPKRIVVHQPYDNVKREWQQVEIGSIFVGDTIAGQGIVSEKTHIQGPHKDKPFEGVHMVFKLGADPVHVWTGPADQIVLAFTRVRGVS